MSESIKVTGAYDADSVVDELKERLVARGKLPVDFDFRTLALDVSEREEIVGQDIMATLGMAESSGRDYLSAELPNCAEIPILNSKRTLLSRLDVDYHIVSDLNEIARNNNVSPRVPKGAWLQYIHYLNPKLYQNLMMAKNPNGYVLPDKIELDRKRIHFRMSHVAIRDSALLDIYNLPAGVLRGHGPVARDLLHQLLLDNHPLLDADKI